MPPRNHSSDTAPGSAARADGSDAEFGLVEDLSVSKSWNQKEEDILGLLHAPATTPRVQFPAIQNALRGTSLELSGLLIEYRDCCAEHGGVLTTRDQQRVRTFESLGKDAGLLPEGFTVSLYGYSPDTADDIARVASELGDDQRLSEQTRARRLQEAIATAEQDGLDISAEDIESICAQRVEARRPDSDESDTNGDTIPSTERFKGVFDRMLGTDTQDSTPTPSDAPAPQDRPSQSPDQDEAEAPAADTLEEPDEADWPQCAHSEEGSRCESRVISLGDECARHPSATLSGPVTETARTADIVDFADTGTWAKTQPVSLTESLSDRVDLDASERAATNDTLEQQPTGDSTDPSSEAGEYTGDESASESASEVEPRSVTPSMGVTASAIPRRVDADAEVFAAVRVRRATEPTVSELQVQIPANQSGKASPPPRSVADGGATAAVSPLPRPLADRDRTTVVERRPRDVGEASTTSAITPAPRDVRFEDAISCVRLLPRQVTDSEAEAVVERAPRPVPLDRTPAIRPLPRHVDWAALTSVVQRRPREVVGAAEAAWRVVPRVVPEDIDPAVRPLPRTVPGTAKAAVRVLPRRTPDLGQGITSRLAVAIRPLPRETDSAEELTEAITPLPRPRVDSDQLTTAVVPLPRTPPEAVFPRRAVRRVSDSADATPLSEVYPNAGDQSISVESGGWSAETNSGPGVAYKSETAQEGGESAAGRHTDAEDSDETMVDSPADEDRDAGEESVESGQSGTAAAASTGEDGERTEDENSEDAPLDGITLSGNWQKAGQEPGDEDSGGGDEDAEATGQSPAPDPDLDLDSVGETTPSGDLSSTPVSREGESRAERESLVDMPDPSETIPGTSDINPGDIPMGDTSTIGTEAALEDIHRVESTLPQEYDPREQRVFGRPNYIQDLLDFKFVFEEDDNYCVSDVDAGGMIAVDEDTFVGLLKVEPRRWAIHTKEKKQQITASYMKSFCNALQFPAEIIAFPTKLDLTDHVQEVEETLKERGEAADSSPLVNHGRAFYPEWLTAYAEQTEMVEQEFFVVVPVARDQIEQFQNEQGLLNSLRKHVSFVDNILAALEDEEGGTQTQCLRELDKRMSQVENALTQSGVTPERLSDRQEVLSVLYMAFNKEMPMHDQFDTGPLTRMDPREELASSDGEALPGDSETFETETPSQLTGGDAQ